MAKQEHAPAILIFGAGPLGQVALEVFQQAGQVVYGFLDDDVAPGTTFQDVPVLSHSQDEKYRSLFGSQCAPFVALPTAAARQQLLAQLRKQQLTVYNALHPTAQVAATASLGQGNLLDAGVYLAPGVTLASGSLLQARAAVGQNARVGNYVHLGMGATVGQSVTLEDEVFIGLGATIVDGRTVGEGARIGAGAVVLQDVPPGATLLGNPAAEVTPGK